MSPDPAHQPARTRLAPRRAGVDARPPGPGDGAAPLRSASPVVDEPLWSGWWRDLVIERYRVATFERALPLRDAGAWVDRVRLGRLVDESLVGVHGPGATGRLVADALRSSGYGPLPDPVVDRRSGLRPPLWKPVRAGDDDLRLGILGSIADALLRRDLPVPAVGAAFAGAERCPSPVTEVIVSATRSAVLAYAVHVEALATSARQSMQVIRDDHLRV